MNTKDFAVICKALGDSSRLRIIQMLFDGEKCGCNLLEIFNNIAHMDFIRIHGPEHHVLDGAVLLTVYYNTGGKIDLQISLNELMKRGLQMPGAICGMWLMSLI